MQTIVAASVPPRVRIGVPGRIQAPNSAPRSVAVIALGHSSAALAAELVRPDVGVTNLRVFGQPVLAPDGSLSGVSQHGDDLQRALAEVDIILVVVHQGDDVSLLPAVSRIARARNVQVTAVYIVAADQKASTAGAEDDTLRKLRADVEILVIARDETYLAALVGALTT